MRLRHSSRPAITPIRLYPDKETEEKLGILEADLRTAWNWLVNMTGYDSKNDSSRARAGYALREGLVGPRPSEPIYEGMSPDEAKRAKEDYIKMCIEWRKSVTAGTKAIPGCQPRKFKELLAHFGCKQDYQLLGRVIDWKYEDREGVRVIRPHAHMLQALMRNYKDFAKGQRCKKFRRHTDSMPVQVRSGKCFLLPSEGESFGTRRGKPFYDCLILINGLKIRGRLPGKKPEGRVLEGVSLVKMADGWWASIKQEVPIRTPPPVIPGSVVGVDAGLDMLVAMSEVRIARHPEVVRFQDVGPMIEGRVPFLVPNPRGKAYAERIAGRQALKKPVGRLHLAANRQLRHLIYNEVLKPLSDVEPIKVERLGGRIGQMGSSKVSAMRTVVRILQERYGARVREVEPHYTSQDCSQCGHRSKESWSYDHGRIGECPSCGHKEDRDRNAARNIASRPLIPLVS